MTKSLQIQVGLVLDSARKCKCYGIPTYERYKKQLRMIPLSTEDYLSAIKRLAEILRV